MSVQQQTQDSPPAASQISVDMLMESRGISERTLIELVDAGSRAAVNGIKSARGEGDSSWSFGKRVLLLISASAQVFLVLVFVYILLRPAEFSADVWHVAATALVSGLPFSAAGYCMGKFSGE